MPEPGPTPEPVTSALEQHVMPSPVNMTVEALPFRFDNDRAGVVVNVYSPVGVATYYFEAPHLRQVAVMLIQETKAAEELPHRIQTASPADLKALENGHGGTPPA